MENKTDHDPSADAGAGEKIRLDHRVILDLVKPNTRVLDLGCGDGELLALLIKHKGCKGTGIEIDEKAIYQCIAKGLTISHGDISSGLTDYSDKRFDYVILNESLQQVINLQQTILSALRVGKQVIVGTPNFCHILARGQLFFKGQVPVTEELPYQWYNTPNVRFMSLKDFRGFCKVNGILIRRERDIGKKRPVRFLPNLFAHTGIFLLEK